MSFGQLAKQLRIGQKKTLRQFCQEHGPDPSNWSKIERDVNRPPRDEKTLVRWAKQLGLLPQTEEWKDFMCQADISRGRIPMEILSDENLVRKLPVFFRTMRGAELTEAQLEDLIRKVREAYTPDELLK
mgnify:FL=1